MSDEDAEASGRDSPPGKSEPNRGDRTAGDDDFGEPERTEPEPRDSGGDVPLSDLAGRIADRRGGDAADASTGDRDADASTRDRDADASTGDRDADAPVGELDTDLANAPPPEDGESPFEQMSVGEIDEDALWSSLESGGETGAGTGDPAEAPVGVDPRSGVESVETPGSDVREHVVPKDTYCQSCPYLDDPPSLACTHEGTDIVEVVDSERFRVRDCPMVDE